MKLQTLNVEFDGFGLSVRNSSSEVAAATQPGTSGE
jgi:hypothetical protein